LNTLLSAYSELMCINAKKYAEGALRKIKVIDTALCVHAHKQISEAMP
jgi:hypothetical protein